MADEEKPRRRVGRKPLRADGVRQVGVHISLDPELIEWAEKQPGGISGTVRRCLEQMLQKGGE